MAGKDFRKRLSRVIPSFQSCQNKDWSSLPPSPISLMFSAISVDCGCRSRRASRKVESKSKPEDTVSPPRQKIDFNVDRDDYTSTDGLTDADSTHGSVATSSDDEMFTMIFHGKKQSMKSKTKKKKRGVACKRRTPRPSCSSSARSGWFGSGECG